MIDETVEQRAKLSLGTSGDSIYQMVYRILAAQYKGSGSLLDLGCGAGRLWPTVSPLFDRYIGVDAVRYDGFPAEGEFHLLNLDDGRVPLADGVADAVVAVETIEHVENPRAFFRELVRLCKPGGIVTVTTPNQLSLLSKLTLIVKNQFNAFTETSYPAHITALLEVDLRRIASECGLTDVEVHFSHKGRLPGMSLSAPKFASRMLPRGLSDNLAITGRKSMSEQGSPNP